MATGSTIDNVFLPTGYKKNITKPETTHKFKGLDDSERNYIISVLKRCKERIKGDGDADILLGGAGYNTTFQNEKARYI